MKQTTNNPLWSSEWRGWQLLAACIAVNPPSEHLQHYVVSHMVNNCRRNDVCGALAGYGIRKAYGEPGEVNDEALTDASGRIPGASIFNSSVSEVVYLEAVNALLYSQGLLGMGLPDYGAANDGVERRGGKGDESKSSVCSFLQHRDILVNGCSMYKKFRNEKNYSERWISVSRDLSKFQWARNKDEKKPKNHDFKKIIGVDSCLPKVRQQH